MDVNNILNSINVIAEKIFKSVEGEVYELLDKLFNISPDILKEDPLKKLIKSDLNDNVVLLLSSLVILFVIVYLITRMISMYNGNEQENIFRFMLKIGVSLIISTSSFYIIETILNLNSMLTDVILSIGEDIVTEKVCFVSLKEVIVDLDSFMVSDFLSLDGMIKGIVSFGATAILLTLIIRYVTVIILIVISPVAFMLAASDSTYSLFFSWCKTFLVNLLMQQVISVILIIPLALKKTDETMYKIVLTGSMYLLYRINNFSKELLSGWSVKKNAK